MNRRRNTAFTLIELLVATSILAMLTLVLLSISNQASAIWQSGENGNQQRQNARLALNFIGNELQMASLPLVPTASDSFHFQINSNTHVGTSLKNPDSLFFQAPVADDLSHGRAMALGYFVRWDNLRPALYRIALGASDSRYIEDDPNTAIASLSSGTGLEEFLFLENVMGLWVKAYDSSGTAASQWDSRASHQLPAHVEVTLLLVDSKHASRLSSAISFSHAEIDNPDAILQKVPDNVRPGVRFVSLKVNLDSALSGAISTAAP